MTLTSQKELFGESPDDQLDSVPPVLDNGDGIGMEHALCAVTIDLQQLITNLYEPTQENREMVTDNTMLQYSGTSLFQTHWNVPIRGVASFQEGEVTM